MNKWNSFFAGGSVFVGSLILIQDVMGHEVYLDYVQNHWISPYISVPSALIGIIIGAYAMARN